MFGQYMLSNIKNNINLEEMTTNQLWVDKDILLENMTCKDFDYEKDSKLIIQNDHQIKMQCIHCVRGDHN